MPLLNERTRKTLTEIFDTKLSDPVAIDLFTQRAAELVVPGYECQTCRETNALLGEVAGLSPRITLRLHDLVSEAEEARRAGVQRIPAIVFQGKNKGTLRYFGVPAGYEFTVLVEGLVDAARGATALAPEIRTRLEGLAEPAHIQVLVTPT